MQTFSQPFPQFIAGLVGATLLFASGCGETTEAQYETGCKTSAVILTVSSGVVPQFNWTPNCAVWNLQVRAVAATNDLMWSTITVGKNEIRPPVTYGIQPAGAEDPYHGVASPLQPGVSYEVTVYVTSNTFKTRTAGQHSFTP
jgi:hypothetical protein